MRTYRKFDNPLATGNADTGPILDTPDPSILNIPQLAQPKRELKSWRSLKILTIVQLAMAILMVFFEAISTGVITNNLGNSPYYYGGPPCAMGTGIWVGILGLITAGLGIGAFRTAYGNKCLMISHFVMCIICTIADGILIIFASICISMLAYYRAYRDHDDALDGVRRGLLANESFLLVAALTHFVTSIVTTAFICRNWCRGGQPAVAVVYLPGSGVDGKDATACRVEIPTGAQVVFVPSDGGQQALVNPTTKHL